MDQHMLEMFGAVLVAVITTLIGPVILEYVKAKLSRQGKVDPIKKELEYSCIIAEELEEIRALLKADRCWVSMFHNGGHYLHSNKSMQKFSIMFESSAPGVAGVGMLFNNIPVSLFSKSVEEIVTKKHIYIQDYSDPTVATFGLKAAAEASGTSSSYSVALLDIMTDQCIGTLGVDYLKKTRLHAADLIVLNEKSQRVAGFLSNFIKSK